MKKKNFHRWFLSILEKYFFFWPHRIRVVYGMVFLLGIFYFLLPSPPLPQIGKKYPLEGGYTSRLAGKPAGFYFTNKSLEEIEDFYKKNFSRSPFLNLPLPVGKVSYDTQYAEIFINDMHNRKNTSFLLHFFHPLRESIVVKGYGEISEKEAEKKSSKKRIFLEPEKGQKFNLKLVVYYIKPPLWALLFTWLGIFIFLPFLVFSLLQSIKSIKSIKQLKKLTL